MILLASSGVLYQVNLDTALAIPIVYFITLLGCVLLREFTHGFLKYLLAVLFVVSFSCLWYTMELDYSPWQYVLVGVILFGAISGLWNWIRDISKDVEKL